MIWVPRADERAHLKFTYKEEKHAIELSLFERRVFEEARESGLV